jgi:Uma2 family endonuclease
MVQSAAVLDRDDVLTRDDALTSEPEYGRPMSIEAWEDLDEDIPGELVDGRLEAEEVADFPHEIVVALLLRALFAWDGARRALILPSEAKYALSKRGGRKPDISVYLSRERKLPRRGASRMPPDIMVEIVSRRPRDRRRDRVEKLREYAAFGVRWYWLVDPEARTFEILRLGDDRLYVHALDVAKGVAEVPGCEGLTLDLDALWRQLDEGLEEDGDPGEA